MVGDEMDELLLYLLVEMGLELAQPPWRKLCRRLPRLRLLRGLRWHGCGFLRLRLPRGCER